MKCCGLGKSWREKRNPVYERNLAKSGKTHPPIREAKKSKEKKKPQGGPRVHPGGKHPLRKNQKGGKKWFGI